MQRPSTCMSPEFSLSLNKWLVLQHLVNCSTFGCGGFKQEQFVSLPKSCPQQLLSWLPTEQPMQCAERPFSYLPMVYAPSRFLVRILSNTNYESFYSLKRDKSISGGGGRMRCHLQHKEKTYCKQKITVSN